MTRAQVHRAYAGSLNRRVRDAACVRLRGAVFLLHSSLHWGSRGLILFLGREISGSRVPVHILHS